MKYHTPYRPDIDGLRALAVLAVVGFHAFPTIVRGGYVGVDVFFVISGFLITSLILGGLERGAFSFADFYIRRTKRIFPALGLVLAACLVFGWLWLLPGEFSTLGKHIASGASFVTNIVQWREAGYFDLSAAHKPLLHLWSLGIEEQFYLACPLITVIVWRQGRRVFLWGGVIVIISFAINMAMIGKHPVGAFYLPFSRAWELVLGSCLASLPPFFLSSSKYFSQLQRNLTSCLGTALIFIAIFTFSPTPNFPGWRALVPTVGTLLILWSGPTAWFNRTLFAHPIAVFIGLISYPIYLWHWPLLSFLAITDLNTRLLRAAAVVLAVGLSWLTYRFIETPLRRAEPWVWKPLLGGFFAIGAVAIAVYITLVPPKSSGAQLATLEKATNDWINPSGAPILFNSQTFYREGKASNTVLFIGDSNMQQYYPRIHDFILQHANQLSVIYATYGGCIPVPGVIDRLPACYNFVQSAYEFAKISDARIIVIAAQWNGYFTRDLSAIEGAPLGSEEGRRKALAVLRSELESLNRLGKKVYFVLNIPIDPQFAPKSWIKRELTRIELQPIYEVQRSIMPPKYEEISRDLTRAATEAGAVVIDPFSYLCDARVCRSVDENGDPRYKDATHLRASFVKVGVTYLDDVLTEAIKAAPLR